jgi:hypothetical protein
MAEWYMQSGTTSTAGGGTPVLLGASGTIAASVIPALSITSERASVNLNARLVSVIAGSTSGAGYTSTSLALWTAPTPITIIGIRVTPMTAWTLATCGAIFEFWSCAAGVICTYCASSTAVCKTIGDVNSCFTLLSSGVTLASCETVRVKVSAPGTTACAQIANYQIDYVTSG